MLDQTTVEQEASRIDEAEIERRQIEATTVRFPDMSITDAYRIQEAWVWRKLRRGRRIIGHKIGLTSRTMQKAMQIDEPDFGVLLDDMFFGNDQAIEASRFTDLRVEVELAFILGKTIPADLEKAEDIYKYTEKVVPAMELIAARSYRTHPVTGYVRTVRDTISDNAANAGIVLGDCNILDVTSDLRWVGAILKKNGIVEETGLAAGILNDPVNGVLWLVKKYAEFGRTLEKGQVILSGSFTKPVMVSPGDSIEVDFGKFGIVKSTFT